MDITMDITTQEIIGQYSLTVAALGALAVLLIVQLIVADAIGIRNKHVPGAAVPSDHNNLLFRATRTVANTNESFSIFVVALLFALLSLASPTAVGYIRTCRRLCSTKKRILLHDHRA